MFINIKKREVSGEYKNICNHSTLVKSITTYSEWKPFETNVSAGAIFNFDFKNDGSILAAACENNCFLLFDPHNSKLISYKSNAHQDSVNCVKFIDSRLFTTCSDDMTVALWDVRKSTEYIALFKGHTNWVKNVEYLPNENCLLSSGFDGSIFKWNLDECEKYSKHINYTNKVLHLEGLLRTQVSKDGTKLIISTLDGYILIIHDIDYEKMFLDLFSFNGAEYRKAQLAYGRRVLRSTINSNNTNCSVFFRKKNRLDMITDFPEGIEHKNIISSLKIHPHDWCVLSRCTTDSKEKEWSCIHDIQSTNNSVKYYEETNHLVKRTKNFCRKREASSINNILDVASSKQSKSVDSFNRPKRMVVNEKTNVEKFIFPSKKLLFYTAESIEQRLYIKEPCFSPDGKIICSPFGCGFRMLGFDKNNCDLNDAMDGYPLQSPARELNELNWTRGTNIYVLTVAHCPVSPLIVSGGIGGCVSFHRPVL